MPICRAHWPAACTKRTPCLYRPSVFFNKVHTYFESGVVIKRRESQREVLLVQSYAQGEQSNGHSRKKLTMESRRRDSAGSQSSAPSVNTAAGAIVTAAAQTRDASTFVTPRQRVSNWWAGVGGSAGGSVPRQPGTVGPDVDRGTIVVIPSVRCLGAFRFCVDAYMMDDDAL